ncbi:toll/interleukin-1 receptor domain-containing protein [Hyphomonas sp.]|uniref:toll/interleukin-1 receptor domain-containing protein n=1 Tax=Hyphomonas sp. TaxID=87 RepID=UPI00391B5D28
MQHDFFLSYRRTDQALARQLVEALRARGGRVWWDEHIEGGEDWREAIVSNLEASRTLVILFSEACNSSRQLRKELAIADLLDKPVIPVLIEPTTPKGHYLYELATRNWLQIHPNPETRIEELSTRLMSELGPGAAALPEPVMAREESGGPDAAEDLELSQTAPTEGSPQPAAPQPRKKTPPPPRKAKARKDEAKPKARRNFLAFKWYEVLLALLIAALPIAGMMSQPVEGRRQTPEILTLDFLLLLLLVLIVVAVIVFPFRYYFRRLRARTALGFYLASVWFLSCVMGVISAFHPEFINEGHGVGGNVLLYITVWGLITLVVSIPAFAIYGALHFQRSLRQVKANTEMIGAPEAGVTAA